MITMNTQRSLGLALVLLAACTQDVAEPNLGIDTEGSGTTTGLDTTTDGEGSTTEPKLDVGDDGPAPQGCAGDANCTLIDILFVIDNSATMGEEQLNLAANFPLLVEKLEELTGPQGQIVNADVNIMVTTSDFGHPLCTGFQAEGYTPRQGAPVFTGCNSRLDAFSEPPHYGSLEIPEACTEVCADDVVPGGDPFIHFDNGGTNVPYNDVSGALACIAPQGINGCGYEAPLESMLQALRPEACWNDPGAPGCDENEEWSWLKKGFLRNGSTVAVAIITDEADCSVASPEGFSFFTDDDNKKYWKRNPELETKSPSSAICWDAGVKCTDENEDGKYEECVSRPNGEVLHPTERYTQFLDYLEQERGHDVVMLGILGVPPVTARSETPPYQPIEGGVADLVYRDWRDGEWDGTQGGGDILPQEWSAGVTAEHKQWEFGIGPGCTGVHTVEADEETDGEETTAFTGQAMPPVRIREVCESRNFVDDDGREQIRCCIESICGDDFSPAMKCLADIIAGTAIPEG